MDKLHQAPVTFLRFTLRSAAVLKSKVTRDHSKYCARMFLNNKVLISTFFLSAFFFFLKEKDFEVKSAFPV